MAAPLPVHLVTKWHGCCQGVHQPLTTTIALWRDVCLAPARFIVPRAVGISGAIQHVAGMSSSKVRGHSLTSPDAFASMPQQACALRGTTACGLSLPHGWEAGACWHAMLASPKPFAPLSACSGHCCHQQRWRRAHLPSERGAGAGALGALAWTNTFSGPRALTDCTCAFPH